MVIYSSSRTLEETYRGVTEQFDDDPSTQEQEIRWDEDGVMYIVLIAGESSGEESSGEDTHEQCWTKTYNFGGTYLGPMFTGNTSFNVQDDEGCEDEGEIDYP